MRSHAYTTRLPMRFDRCATHNERSNMLTGRDLEPIRKRSSGRRRQCLRLPGRTSVSDFSDRLLVSVRARSSSERRIIAPAHAESPPDTALPFIPPALLLLRGFPLFPPAPLLPRGFPLFPPPPCSHEGRRGRWEQAAHPRTGRVTASPLLPSPLAGEGVGGPAGDPAPHPPYPLLPPGEQGAFVGARPHLDRRPHA